MNKNNNNPENKKVSAEEMARIIAKNLNSQQDNNYGDDNFSAEEYETKAYHDAAVKAMERSGVKTATVNESKNNSQKSKKKKKSSSGKFVKGFISALVIVVVVGGAGVYLAGMNSHKGVFLDNTYINDVNVSGKTEKEALKILEKNNALPDGFNIDKLSGKTERIKLSDMGYVDNTEARVSQYFSQQNHYTWFKNLFSRTDFKWKTDFKYKKEDLEKIIKEKIIDDKEATKPENAKLYRGDDGVYAIQKEKEGTKINPSKAGEVYKYIEEQIDSGNYNIDISGLDVYQKAEVTAQNLQKTCDAINSMTSLKLTFDFNYTKEVLEGDTIMDWVSVSKDGSTYTVDNEKVMKYVEGLAEKYDTYGKPRKFRTTRKGVITIQKGEGCYGWWIDQEKTRDLIVKKIKSGKSCKLEPVYYVHPDNGYEYTANPEWRTKDKDYSDTYIEVDLTAQHLWYYKDGKLKMQTDIVSGYDGDPQRITHSGVYKLWIKERSKTLEGAVNGVSYASYVDYWNNISTVGIGLHDASWQGGDFNSSKYHTPGYGSHGCINMPLDKAKYVYDNVDYGTPVFVYYKEGKSKTR